MLFSRKDRKAKCPNCRRRSYVNSCIVCRKKRCTSCGAWNYWYVLQRGDRSKIVETRSFCSQDCEKRWLEPYIDKFHREYKETANALLKENRRAVEEWFSVQMGYQGYDVWCEELERFFNNPRFEEALESILTGKTRVAEFETLNEAVEFTIALSSHCSSQKNALEHIHVTRADPSLLHDILRSPYYVVVDEIWDKENSAC